MPASPMAISGVSCVTPRAIFGADTGTACPVLDINCCPWTVNFRTGDPAFPAELQIADRSPEKTFPIP